MELDQVFSIIQDWEGTEVELYLERKDGSSYVCRLRRKVTPQFQ